MKTLNKFEFGGAARGKYDWDTLLNGSIYQLDEGVDYTSKASAFGMMARIQAGVRGRTLTLKKIDGGVVIQAGEEGSAPVKERKKYKKSGAGANGIAAKTAPKPKAKSH